MDVLPTLLSIANISTEHKFDGVDFSQDLFENEKLKNRTTFWRYRNQLVAREGDWKYLKTKDYEYLFNLESDLPEQIDLKETNSKKFQHLKSLMTNWENEINKYPQQTQ